MCTKKNISSTLTIEMEGVARDVLDFAKAACSLAKQEWNADTKRALLLAISDLPINRAVWPVLDVYKPMVCSAVEKRIRRKRRKFLSPVKRASAGTMRVIDPTRVMERRFYEIPPDVIVSYILIHIVTRLTHSEKYYVSKLWGYFRDDVIRSHWFIFRSLRITPWKATIPVRRQQLFFISMLNDDNFARAMACTDESTPFTNLSKLEIIAYSEATFPALPRLPSLTNLNARMDHTSNLSTQSFVETIRVLCVRISTMKTLDVYLPSLHTLTIRSPRNTRLHILSAKRTTPKLTPSSLRINCSMGSDLENHVDVHSIKRLRTKFYMTSKLFISRCEHLQELRIDKIRPSCTFIPISDSSLRILRVKNLERLFPLRGGVPLPPIFSILTHLKISVSAKAVNKYLVYGTELIYLQVFITKAGCKPGTDYNIGRSWNTPKLRTLIIAVIIVKYGSIWFNKTIIYAFNTPPIMLHTLQLENLNTRKAFNSQMIPHLAILSTYTCVLHLHDPIHNLKALNICDGIRSNVGPLFTRSLHSIVITETYKSMYHSLKTVLVPNIEVYALMFSYERRGMFSGLFYLCDSVWDNIFAVMAELCSMRRKVRSASRLPLKMLTTKDFSIHRTYNDAKFGISPTKKTFKRNTKYHVVAACVSMLKTLNNTKRWWTKTMWVHD